MKLSENFLAERYQKDQKYIRIHNKYRRNYRTSVVTCKFYNTYEAIDLTTANADIVKAIKIDKDKGPKDKYKWSITDNQEYGWFNEPLVPLENDNVFYFPRRTCSLVEIGMKLRQEQQKFKR